MMKFIVDGIDSISDDNPYYPDFDEAIEAAKKLNFPEPVGIWNLDRFTKVPEAIIYKGYHYLNESPCDKKGKKKNDKSKRF